MILSTSAADAWAQASGYPAGRLIRQFTMKTHRPDKGPDMTWLYILFADLFEIAWPFVLKWSAPFSRWAPLFVVIICAIPANYLLAEAVQRLPAATVYAAFLRELGRPERRLSEWCFLARARALAGSTP